MQRPPPTSRHVLAGALWRLLAIPPFFGLLFFLPAGTWRWWQAWVYIAVLLVPMAFSLPYLLARSPDLLARRMHMREQEPAQRRILALSSAPMTGTFLFPGFDHRFGWSHVPDPVVIAADLVVLAGYAIVLLTYRENRFASRVVEVEETQTLISTGPYAWVRHPMYVGTLLMFGATPLALGSAWGLLFSAPVLWTLVARIHNEEEVLLRDLPGYAAYQARVPYRLLPGVW